MKYLIDLDPKVGGRKDAESWQVAQVLPPDMSILHDIKEYSTIFVPVVSNYNDSLSYDGANFALRILLYFLCEGRTDVDIVLMGNESQENFLLHYDYPNLLKIPGLSYIRFNKNIVASFESTPRTLLSPVDYVPYLNNLGLKLPSSFKSTHSLTNEWCLYKWNSFMGFPLESADLDGILYFDYLRTLDILNPIIDKKVPQKILEDIHKFPPSRVLLIDDKAGWHTFFDRLFEGSDVELHCLGDDFNKRAFDDIKNIVAKEIGAFRPDVIILDFRLMEDADTEFKDNMNKISGYKVLAEVVKGKYNKPKESFGSQALIFTATSRIENILMLRDTGNADGFILKEKPEKYNGKGKSGDTLRKMTNKLKVSIVRAQFLVPLNESLNKLSTVENQMSEIGGLISYVVQVIRQITQKNDLTLDILKMVYLNLMYILESIKTTEKLNDFIQHSGVYDKLDETKGSWNYLCDIRNFIAHGKLKKENKTIKEIVSTEELMKKWILTLSNFIHQFLTLYLKK